MSQDSISRLLTLVFTDLVDSTALKSQRGDQAAGELISRDRENVQRLAAQNSGRIIDWAGDGCFLTFETSSEAILFALKLQMLHASDDDLPKIRVGIHMGEVTEKEGPQGPNGPPRIEGLAVDLAARVQGLAQPGQVLLSAAVQQSGRQRLGADALDRPIVWSTYGEYSLKGVDEPVLIAEAGIEGLSPLTAPVASEKAAPVHVEGTRQEKTASDLRLLKRLFRRPQDALSALVVIGAIALGFFWYSTLDSKGIEARSNWAREQVPEIRRLVEAEDYTAAFTLAKEVEEIIPEDTGLQELLFRAGATVTITSDPPGAQVWRKRYVTPDAEWEEAGTTPIEGLQVAMDTYRWKFEMDGYETREAASSPSSVALAPERDLFVEGSFEAVNPNAFHVQLRESGVPDVDLTAVGAGTFMPALSGLPLAPMSIDSFWMQRTEVTNAMFKEFIEAGGYTNQTYWTEPFVSEGKEISWDEAMARFMDASGRKHGPSEWITGAYPVGQTAEHPVGGVSWYEAMAYAKFRNMTLPTIFHWLKGAMPDYEIAIPFLPKVIPLSNFDSGVPVEVATTNAMSPWGLYDMAGNMREWCLNESTNSRFSLGSSYNEPEYMFPFAATKSPWDRSAENGFRCMRLHEGDSIREDLAKSFLDLNLYKTDVPEMSDEVFDNFTAAALTPRGSPELDVRSELVEPYGEHWRHEIVSMRTNYESNDRLLVHLYLPEESPKPAPTVIFFPGINGLVMQRFVTIPSEDLDFLLRDGRILVKPIYHGMYERNDGQGAQQFSDQNALLDSIIKWSADITRTIDYLESRDEVSLENLTYVGLSLGSMVGPIFLSVEERFKVGILLAGGLYGQFGLTPTAQSSPLTYARHTDVPILMLNGRFDYVFPVEQSQIPFFNAFRAPAEHKRHVVYESGHVDMPRAMIVQETLDWLTKYQPMEQ